ncbi:MAG: conjugative transposon protein TraM [Bacteroidetes bacterium GWF2_42_66]|nr:MAG: conjugative transposon protein TraM [Bacteroidetes bacterium GWA2_42_15]OFX98208.1 MAG: conjugative transposon protein TraM [Bacteroidetes bacterium GWE2_42_39]OFY42593.1 MAG: conjugative transposon protein TraM [Bacteroidetes bacterium GWF2_42_66]HBL74312.1 conjugative transposon protein TraM [Prolixibacteraceae bacterium]HCU64082.1 conjugative transposon protein TraM [Prolixibacteraceae bacterium]
MKEKENNSGAKPDVEEKKPLSPQQLQKRKKMVIFPLFFLLFAISMWLIFAPSADKKEEPGDVFNTNLPTPKKSGIIADKRDAYRQEAMRAKEQEKIRSLQDFAFILGGETAEEKTSPGKAGLQGVPEPTGNSVKSSRLKNSSGNSRANAFRSSAGQYQDINRQLGSFYKETEPETNGQEQAGLEERIGKLELQLQEKNEAEQQLALVEKSYEIAARYMPADKAESETVAAPVLNASETEKDAVSLPVSQVSGKVVSLLAAPMPDSVFMKEYTKPRNLGFHTVAGREMEPEKNTINACISKTVTITNGQEVQVRLLEPVRAGKMLIPENTLISGSARISGERMNVSITHIQYAGSIIPVKIEVFDMDGNPGISVPGSEELNAVKEVTANMGTSMGSSITITDNAGSQLMADLGRGIVQGASQYAGKKMRTVRVTLKAGYRVLLLPSMQ